MRSANTRFWLITVSLLVVNIVGIIWIRAALVPTGAVRVLAYEPRENVGSAERVQLLFSAPVVGEDLVGVPLVSPPFQLDPPVKGRWEWADRQRLDFVLDRPLPPGRRFRLAADPGFAVICGRPLVGDTEFDLSTGSLELLHCRLLSADARHVNFDVRFDQPVNPADLERHLTVRAAGGLEPLAAEVLDRAPASRLTCRVPRPESRQLLVALGGELRGDGAELALGTPVERRLTIPTSFAFVGARVPTPATERQLEVTLDFSERLGQPEEPLTIAVTPAVPGGLETRVRYRSLIVSGEFEAGRRYTATVPAGVVSRAGEKLAEAVEVELAFPDRRASVSIPFDRGVLSPRGNRNLDVDVVNVAGLRVATSRVHPNNLVAHLRGDSPDETSRDYATQEFPVDVARNTVERLTLELADLLPERSGIFRVGVEATDHTWTRDAAIFALTDLAITAKTGPRAVRVWVTSLGSGRPIEGVAVSALTYTNQTIAASVTNEDGVATLEAPDDHPDGRPWVVLAELDGDLGYLRLDQRHWVPRDVDVSGRAHRDGYEVFCYPERGVYRPGETVHLSGIVRNSDGETPAPFPLELTVRRPDGVKVAERIVEVDADSEGVFHVDHAVAADAPNGPHRFELALPGGGDRLGSTKALVESFVPLRLELNAALEKTRHLEGEPIAVDVSARYLFGGMPVDIPVRAEFRLVPMRFRSQAHPEFRFASLPDVAKREPLVVDGVIDAQGRARLVMTPPGGLEATLWEVHGTVTLTEPGSRSVSAPVQTRIDTVDRHLGVRLVGGTMAPVGETFEVETITVDGADEPTESGPFTATLARLDYESRLEEVRGRTVWRSVEREQPVQSLEFDADPLATRRELQLVCPTSGPYVLRLIDATSLARTELRFHAAVHGSMSQSVSLERAEHLEVILEGEDHSPGEPLRTIVRAPFAGTLWLTVETDRVLHDEVIAMTENVVSVELPLPAQIRGGAYIGATVVRALDPEDETWLPLRAYGLARVEVRPAGHELELTIDAPDEARPGDSIEVSVATGLEESARVHLWAVDEGILGLTAHETPAPVDYFLAQRSLGIRSSDVFAELLPDHRRPADMTRIGGDGRFGLDASRRSLVPLKQRDSALLWLESRSTDEGGRLTTRLRLPDFNGELRLMAVAVAGDRYGAAERALTVSAPLVAEASWPRFAAPGDRFRVPVKVFNRTDEPLDVRLEVETTGPLAVTSVHLETAPAAAGAAPESGPRPATSPDGESSVAVAILVSPALVVPPGGALTEWLRVTANDTGLAEVVVRARAMVAGEEIVSRSATPLTVRSAGHLHGEVRLAVVDAGTPLDLAGLPDYAAGTALTEIHVGATPELELQPIFERVIDYPYGCLEQTTSRLLTLLAVPPSLLERLGTDLDGRIAAGIARLWSMQTRGGGLAYWTGGREPHLWGSAYAARALAAARARGHDVPVELREALVDYLVRALGRGDEDANSTAFLCYVLALHDRAQEGWLARLAERGAELDLAGRAHVALAWASLGRLDRARPMIPEHLEDEIPTTTSGRLTSLPRQEAVLLSALLEVEPEHPWTVLLAQRLMERAGRRPSTLEGASILEALGRHAGRTRTTPAFSGAVLVDGEEFRRFDHEADVALSLERAPGSVRVVSEGTGSIHVMLKSEGVLEGADRLHDRGLEVRRLWFGPTGEAIDPKAAAAGALRVGDLVRVQVSLRSRSAGSRRIDNVAIVDALPAGMEVENPRLVTSASRAGGNRADHVEFLDDRVVVFAPAIAERRFFEYSLRVTALGSFTIPPIQASCMYDGTLASVSGGGELEVRQ